ncbi:NDP-sugar synthase [Candidatus Woesearchaeota archaeon]|nr:NDP-sugar synthase [Candidatus Woesearchaeota archaeon]
MSIKDLDVPVSAVQTSAGRGSRIKPLNMSSESQAFPKGLIRIMGNPIAEIQMEQFKAAQLTKLYVITQYLENRHFLSERYSDGSRFGMKIRYSYPKDDEVNNGSGDAILRNIEKKHLKGHSIVLANDNLYEYDAEEVLRNHIASGAAISIMTVRIPAMETIATYGIVETDETKRVTRLVEKPEGIEGLVEFFRTDDVAKIRQAHCKINTAGYIINNEWLEHLAQNEPWIKEGRAAKYPDGSNGFDMAGSLLTGLITANHPIQTIPIDNWGDFGSCSFFLDTFIRVLEGAFPSVYKILKNQGYWHDPEKNVWIHPTTLELPNNEGKTLQQRIEEGKVKIGPNVFIGRETIIEDGVEIRNSDIEKYAAIRKGAKIEKAYVAQFGTIGSHATIRACALGLGVTVLSTEERKSLVNGRSVIGPEVKIPPGTSIYETKVFPGYKFDENNSKVYRGMELVA